MLDILPGVASKNIAYAHLGYTEPIREFPLRSNGLADFSDNQYCEFWSNTASLIDSCRYRFEMIWIHAWRKAAKMIQFQIFRNGPVGAFVVNACCSTLLAVMPHAPITMLGTHSSLPNPARGFVAMILDNVIHWRNALMVAFEKLSRLSLYKIKFGIVEFANGCFVTASAMAEAIFNRHIAPSSGKVAARAGRLQPLEIA